MIVAVVSFLLIACAIVAYTETTIKTVYGTPIRVTNALLDIARTYTDKQVHLFFNDYYPEKIEELKKHLHQDERNYKIVTTTRDGNELLKWVEPQLNQNSHMHFFLLHDLFTTTDTDVDRQFRAAEVKLGNEGIGIVYGNKYMDDEHPNNFKIDVILFVADEECLKHLNHYAEGRFHGLNDDYRRYIAIINSDKIRRQYDSIVSDGDIVSKHNFRLPETIQVPHEVGGKEYRNHLFVSDTTGYAKMKLNTWETGVIEEEEKQSDFVCWIRNPSRGSWALCIPYEIDGETKPTFPDFIVIRKDDILGYVIDILEPHNPEFKDNLGKAKGFAEYARQNRNVGRIQLIRMGKDAAGKNRFKRLDMSKSAIRDKVSHATTNDELDHIFDIDGFFM